MSRALWVGVIAFAITVPWGKWIIPALLKRNIGKNIRSDGPASHQVKSGTATMGGIYFVGFLALITIGLAIAGYTQSPLPLLAMLAFGLVGAFDDLRGLQDKEGIGWLAGHKFPVQWAMALAVALVVTSVPDAQRLVLPVSGTVVHIGWWVLPITAFGLVSMANAVNLTDGLDGLAGGTSAIAALAYGVICLTDGRSGLAMFCFALVGVLAAFLWYNVNPARLFMGDVGSEALGAGLTVIAVLSGHWLLLPVIGLLFVSESLSVMVQVAWFKYTKRRYGEGRRILRMAPLHHHFELGGWSETQITLRFWLLMAMMACIGIGLAVPWH